MRSIDDPSSMTPDERFPEIAAILAGGMLRLHAREVLSCSNIYQYLPEKVSREN